VKTQQMTKYILGGVIAVGLTFFYASANAQAKETKIYQSHSPRCTLLGRQARY
jgi:hypothetical protein